MDDSATPFWLQALVTIAMLVLLLGIVAWQTRYDRKEFSVLRVFIVAVISLLSSLPFVAAFWWFVPHETDKHNPLLLAAVFVPIFILEAWGMILGFRRLRQKSHESTKV